MSNASRINRVSQCLANGRHSTLLTLEVRDPIVLSFLAKFEENQRNEKALEALKVGVIALQSASPSLDTQVVQEKFAEIALRLKYFAERNGLVPKSISDVFGDQGSLSRTLGSIFGSEGKLARLLDNQIGPTSEFGKTLDPKNRAGFLSLVEKTVSEQVGKVLVQLSLDEGDSAMSHLKDMISHSLGEFKKALGVKEGQKEESQRGHLKGLDFEANIYQRLAEWANQLDDRAEFIGATPGQNGKKDGDHLITLGESTGAPGLRIVIETKDQPKSLKEAHRELQKAKKTRDASCGVFVFAKGREPSEMGDLHRLGEDFYCTVDKECLEAGGPLYALEYAYKIARVSVVASVRKQESGNLDLQGIHDHIDALTNWIKPMGDIASKACSIRKNGEAIEDSARTIQKDLEVRLKDVLELLRRQNTSL